LQQRLHPESNAGLGRTGFAQSCGAYNEQYTTCD
jgi:hypothetical protein